MCAVSDNAVLTPVSDIKGLAHLRRQVELLRLREPKKWILGRFEVYEHLYGRPLSTTLTPYIYIRGIN